MLKNKEINIDNNLEQFISNLIGDIYCGDGTYIGDEQIIEIEKQRKNNTKKGVMALCETYINNDLVGEFNDLMVRFPTWKMTSLDLERIITYFILGQCNITYYNAKQSEIALIERKSRAKGISLEMENNIHKRLRYYTFHLKGLISDLQQHIETLEETKQPTFDFKNTNITYTKKLKNILRENKKITH